MDPGYYQHSGRFSPGGLLLGIVAGGLAGIVLAYAYGYAILYIPLAGVITFLLSGGFGGLLGAAEAIVLKWQKVRSTAAALVATLLVAVASWYLSWAVWVYALLRKENVEASLPAIALQPGALWEIIQEINKTGAWTIRSFTPTGTVLWIFWGLEAVVILGVALAVALKFMDAEPYCEQCNKWCKEAPDVARLAMGNQDEMKQHLEMKDLAYMEKAGAPAKDSGAWFAFSIHSCPECRQTHTLTVKTVTVTLDNKGKESKEEKEFVNKLLLSPHEAETVRSIGQKLTPKLDVGSAPTG